MARTYIAMTLAAGAVAVAASLWSLSGAAPPEAPLRVAAGAGLVLASCFLIQSRSLTLAWKGQRIFVYPDEAVVLVAFVYLSPPAVILAAVAASVAAHAVLRKPLVKATFNVSAYATSLALAGGAYEAARHAGFESLPAALLVPIVASAANQLIVAGLLTALAGESTRTLVRPELLSSIAVSSVAGITLGFLALALIGLHPASVVLIVPVGLAFHHAIAAEYRHQNELAARRALARVGERLVGVSSEEAIVQEAYDAAKNAFPLREFRVTLESGGEPAREWRLGEGMHDASRAAVVSADIRDQRGARRGEIALTVGAKSVTQLAEDRELAALVAGYLSMALGTSDALRGLQDAQQRLRDVFNAARDPILLLDSGGRLVYHNAVAEETFGYLDMTTAGTALEGVLEPESAQRLWERVASLAEDDRVVEVETRGAPPERRILELGLSTIGIGGARPGILVLARDVTERRILEREAAAHREAAARSERLAALGILVAGVAHEINNPLMYLRGQIELALMDVDEAGERLSRAGLSDDLDLGETRHGLEVALSGAERIARIAKALKVVARQGATEREPVDAVSVLRDVEDLIRVRLPDNVTLHVDAEAPGPVVTANASEIHQVLLNLARNAVDAIGTRVGSVRLACRAAEGHVELSVTDDGPGIPPEVRAQLFTPFHTTKHDGTGLGLSIAHTIVKDHGGEILVDSEPGRGARFVVRLPLPAAEECATASG